MKRASHRIILALTLLTLLPFVASAQEAAPTSPAPLPPVYTEQQLDQMTAPIALYPDQLIGQILMASTYPLEVVEAYRWRQDPQNAQLNGDQLQAAISQQPWDPSVKSLVPFPQVLSMMNNNLQWTEQLGDAFLGNQPAVMDSVQRLRTQAQAAGNLQSTPQQTVAGEPGAFTIEPANPQVVFVPTYNPQVVYGAWPWAAYPPYYFPPPPGYGYIDVGPLAFFTTGIVLADWFWGWDRWDWRNHHIDIDQGRWVDLNRGRPPHFSGDVWAHNPAHRHGVPYTSPAVRAQFQPAADAARRNFRGFAPQAENRGGPAGAGVRQSAVERPSAVSATESLARQRSVSATGRATSNAPVAAPQRAVQRPQVQQRTAPVYESFSRGPDVRAQSARGAYSRASRPATPVSVAPAVRSAPAARPAPAVRSAPSGGGQRGNGGGGQNDRDHR